MKFLPRTLDDSNLMALRTYYDRGTDNYDIADDILTFVYKDIDTGKIYAEEIINPKILIYIVKPQYRNYDHYKSFIDKSECDCYSVSYKSKLKEVANILGCTTKEAKYSKYVANLDLDIEHFYMMEFYKEYGFKTDSKPLRLAFSDIETDIINFTGFAGPGEAPINAISYFDANTKDMFTFLCIQDNIPHVPEIHKKYKVYENLRKKFKDQTIYFIEHLAEFKKDCKNNFEDTYGKIEYHFLVFEDEISMLKAYWNTIESRENDMLFFWNAPYDISNLVERVKVLGYDPNEIIPSPIFKYPKVRWEEDKNPVVHKKRHTFNLYIKPTIMDQMQNYAGVRSGKGKLPSLRLNTIGRNVLNDEKIDYSEYGNIRFFCYEDWWKFVLYNIKDVLLQYGIELKTKDASYVYMVMTTSSLKPNEIFTSTSVVGNDLRLFAELEKNKVMGSNKNKLFKKPMTEEERKQAKKDKFAGAFVMNPNHCSSTGFKLLGMLNKYIHDHAIDMDIASEYPTGMLIMNCCEETMVGKVYLKHPEEINIKKYENMYTIDSDDEVIYKKTTDPSVLMVEGISENNPLAFGETFFGLPSSESILNHLSENIELIEK